MTPRSVLVVRTRARVLRTPLLSLARSMRVALLKIDPHARQPQLRPLAPLGRVLQHPRFVHRTRSTLVGRTNALYRQLLGRAVCSAARAPIGARSVVSRFPSGRPVGCARMTAAASVPTTRVTRGSSGDCSPVDRDDLSEGRRRVLCPYNRVSVGLPARVRLVGGRPRSGIPTFIPTTARHGSEESNTRYHEIPDQTAFSDKGRLPTNTGLGPTRSSRAPPRSSGSSSAGPSRECTSTSSDLGFRRPPIGLPMSVWAGIRGATGPAGPARAPAFPAGWPRPVPWAMSRCAARGGRTHCLRDQPAPPRERRLDRCRSSSHPGQRAARPLRPGRSPRG